MGRWTTSPTWPRSTSAGPRACRPPSAGWPTSTAPPSSCGATSSAVVHGDACAPNTLVDDAGRWVGHVDPGGVGVGDRWADLAVASLSLDCNVGEGHQPELSAAYGIEPDEERIAWYRALWQQES
ncbi:phosphotransferase [Klenkia sp. LSe6-5]|uniref:Phosphotransferase n=1 Tax=Klenkia sesuvii TaxID=3103137 RepID=A0ABU8DSJ9_9ACTN